jgi:hypothetical protein
VTGDLAAWLLADDGPIAEDERVAREASDGPDGSLSVDGPGWPAHIARWDPARVLAECAAKRAIVEAHRSRPFEFCHTCLELRPERQGEQITRAYAPCPTLLALAQPFAGRSGWRDEWVA